MDNFVRAVKKISKQENNVRLIATLLNSNLLKCLPFETSDERKTLTKISDELSTKNKKELQKGLKLLKDNNLAEYDNNKRGWYRLE